MKEKALFSSIFLVMKVVFFPVLWGVFGSQRACHGYWVGAKSHGCWAWPKIPPWLLYSDWEPIMVILTVVQDPVTVVSWRLSPSWAFVWGHVSPLRLWYRAWEPGMVVIWGSGSLSRLLYVAQDLIMVREDGTPRNHFVALPHVTWKDCATDYSQLCAE